MPGWYIHLEAARLSVERLEAGDVPPEYGIDPAEAQRLGRLAHTWRNYLALGALGPDLFFLLPDFKAPAGGPLFSVADWIFDVWTKVEEQFLGPWDKWMGPLGTNDQQLAAQLTGGLNQQIAQAMDLVADAISNAIITVPARTIDVFGLLTSGPPQGLAESAFYWSDMLHYRRTYDVPRLLFQKARAAELAATTDDERKDAEAGQAFALGWMSHCATDVVGHALTNAKCGGPFRLHWQRHHLVENHFDSHAYAGRFGGGTHYRTIGTSAIHFRIAWRRRDDAPYDGRDDAPAYDYFAGFPAYPVGTTAADDLARRQHFSMAPGTLPAHLVTLLGDALREVYADTAPDITPEVLNDAAPAFSDDGRPNEDALQVMWQVVFRFLTHLSSSGLSLIPPPSPPVLNDHPFPTPPGGSPGTDAGRGVDLSDDEITLLDILLAVVAWLIFIGQVIAWLVTVLPGLVIDVATFPARAVLHYAVVSPLFSMYLASRRLLVQSGFISPDTAEIDPGLIELGRSSTFWRSSLRADLAEATGFAPPTTGTDEPSGRRARTDEWHADPAYPRDTPRDPSPALSQLLAAMGGPPTVPSRGAQDPFSEWVFPWRYPERDVQGDRIGWEADLVHAGPFTMGDDARTLLGATTTNVEVAEQYEAATSADETEAISHKRLPLDQHLGHPVDYSLYLISRLTANRDVPSFNLDSDRGYAWQCWDWARHTPGTDPVLGDVWACKPFWDPTSGSAPPPYEMEQPCSPPAQFDPHWAAGQPGTTDPLPRHSFDPAQRRLVHYLDRPAATPATCGDAPADGAIPAAQRERAQLPPEGEPGA